MKHNYTEEKLIEFVCGDCDIFDQLEIEHAIEENIFLKEDVNEIKNSLNILPKIKFSPKTSTLASILSFSKKSFELAR